MVVPSIYGHRLLRSLGPLVGDGYKVSPQLVDAKITDANLVSSRLENSDFHCPALDLDLPCALIPSSTTGHYHLYLDHPMEWRAYKKLLLALRDAGILEDGFVNCSIDRKQSCLRPPWVRK